MAKDNFSSDMDLFRFIRRKRMHGFGLHFILSNSLRSNSARLAFSRPLRDSKFIFDITKDPTNINEIEDKWF